MAWYKGSYVPIFNLTEKEFMVNMFGGWRHQFRGSFRTSTYVERPVRASRTLLRFQHHSPRLWRYGVEWALQNLIKSLAQLNGLASVKDVLFIKPVAELAGLSFELNQVLNRGRAFLADSYEFHPTSFLEHRVKSKPNKASQYFKAFVDFLYTLTVLAKKLYRFYSEGTAVFSDPEVGLTLDNFYSSFHSLKSAWDALLVSGKVDSLLPLEERRMMLRDYWLGSKRGSRLFAPLWVRAYGTNYYSLEYLKRNPYPLNSIFSTDGVVFWHNYMRKSLRGGLVSWEFRTKKLLHFFKRLRVIGQKRYANSNVVSVSIRPILALFGDQVKQFGWDCLSFGLARGVFWGLGTFYSVLFNTFLGSRWLTTCNLLQARHLSYFMYLRRLWCWLALLFSWFFKVSIGELSTKFLTKK